jgi:hypothetical protein
MGINMSIEEQWDELLSQAIEQIQTGLKAMRETKVDNNDLWFKNLLCGILDCALFDYRAVQTGIRDSCSVPKAAWGRRNLLELRTITEYVLASAENAADFRNDFVIDVREFWDALAKIQKDAHKKLLSMLAERVEKADGAERDLFERIYQIEAERGPQTESTETEAAAYKKLMSDLGLKDNAKSKRVSEIARLLDQKEEFDPVFRVASKLMHRTALSIAASNITGGLDELRPFISKAAAYDLLEIYRLINAYIKANGMRPPSVRAI